MPNPFSLRRLWIVALLGVLCTLAALSVTLAAPEKSAPQQQARHPHTDSNAHRFAYPNPDCNLYTDPQRTFCGPAQRSCHFRLPHASTRC